MRCGQQLSDLIEKFSDIMLKTSTVISLTHLEEMVLPTEPGTAPVASKPYHQPLKHHRFVKEELTNLLEAGRIDHILAKLKGAWYFSSLDTRSGYHHISIHPESRPKTTFICLCGKFQWKRVSYGIAHAPNVFLSIVFKLFCDYLDDFMIFCIDDVIVYSKTEQHHLIHLQKIFEKF